MVEVTHLSECLVRTGGSLKNRKRHSVNCWLSEASTLGSSKRALVSARRRDPHRDTEILSAQRSAPDEFHPRSGLAMSAEVSGCSERPLIFREEKNSVLQTRTLEIKGQDGPSS